LSAVGESGHVIGFAIAIGLVRSLRMLRTHRAGVRDKDIAGRRGFDREES
jgi:hypothetical protein